jgi:RNA polymerase sigma-70 factor (ECF subfamily)
MERIADRELIERLPSDEAVQALYERYGRLVFSVSLGILKNADLAEDATQSVFLVLLGKAYELRGHGNLAGWFYVASVRAARSLARAERAREARDRAYLDRPRMALPAETSLDLAIALGRLRATDREAVLLRFANQLSFEEIGQELQLTANAARMRVERALRTLRARLAGQDSSAGLAILLSRAPNRQAPIRPAVGPGHGGPLPSPWHLAVPFVRGQIMLTPKLLPLLLIAPAAVGGYMAYKTGLRQSAPGSRMTFKSQSLLDEKGTPTASDLVFFSVPYQNGKPAGGGHENGEVASFSQPATDQVFIGRNRVEMSLIPHGKPGAYFCDVKLLSTPDPDGNRWASLKQKLQAPSLGQFTWVSGQQYYVAINPAPSAAFHLYSSESQVPESEKGNYFRVALVAKSGAREDPKFWNTHLVSGRYDDEVVSTKPVSATLDVTFTENGSELSHQQIQASNAQVGTFVVSRPDGIRSEISFVPQILGDAKPYVMWHWYEFREHKAPGAPRDPSSGYGSMGGCSSRFEPLVGRTSDLAFGGAPRNEADLHCKVKVISLNSSKPTP